MKRKITPAWGLLLILIAAVVIWRSHDARELVPWRTDLESARKEALASHKLLFVDFSASWCGPCQEMRSTTWADKSVADSLAGYVPVSIDFDANQGLVQQFQVDGIPAMFIVDPQTGKVLRGIDGELTPDAFLQWIKG